MVIDLLTTKDILTIVGIVVPVVGGIVLYLRRRLDKLQDNHLAHIDEKIDGVGEKVDNLSTDVQRFMGKFEGLDLDARVTRLERETR